jgi:hypothetical protein
MKCFVLPILLAAGLPAADFRITLAMNAFTTASYKQLSGGDGNLILSPFNIATALSMALAGARGQTAEEIQSVLHSITTPPTMPPLEPCLPASPRPPTPQATNYTPRTETLGAERIRHPGGV